MVVDRAMLYGKLTVEYMQEHVPFPGLYFFINKNKQAIRIGKSHSWLLNARIGQYGGYSNAGWGEDIKVSCICWPHPASAADIGQIKILECVFIRKLQPEWNNKGKRSSRYDQIIQSDTILAKIVA